MLLLFYYNFHEFSTDSTTENQQLKQNEFRVKIKSFIRLLDLRQTQYQILMMKPQAWKTIIHFMCVCGAFEYV